MTGIELIEAERKRQVGAEGWEPEHDDEHTNGELARAASCYALAWSKDAIPVRWPFESGWWKPSDRIRNLVKAGALIAAEIDRLQRAERKPRP